MKSREYEEAVSRVAERLRVCSRRVRQAEPALQIPAITVGQAPPAALSEQTLRESTLELRGGAVGFGSKNRIQGASGYCHQIDVSVETAGVLLIAECKCWQKGVDTEAALAFSARYIDIKSRLGKQKKVLAALATIKGFDPGAVQLAKFFEVDLWYVLNEQEFLCRVERAVSAGLSDSVNIEQIVEHQLVRAANLPQ